MAWVTEQRHSWNPANPCDVPMDSEGMRLGTMGKRIGMFAEIRNAILSHYDRQLRNDIAPFKEKLSNDCWERETIIWKEGESTSFTLLEPSLDASKPGFRQIATEGVLRRCSWLRSFDRQYSGEFETWCSTVKVYSADPFMIPFRWLKQTQQDP